MPGKSPRKPLCSMCRCVPPSAVEGVPVRPVVLEGLTVTPWLDDRGARPKIMYSLKATGLAAPKRLSYTTKVA